MNRAACTIVSPNYLPYARVLANSYLYHHPGHRFFVLIVADLSDPIAFQAEPFTPVLLSHIGLADLRAEAMKYDILELNTNVKPTFLQHLLHTQALDQLVYLDPDIFVYAPLTPVFQALDAGAALVLTPHITTPVNDGKLPAEQDHLYNGTYNLGFAAVSNSPESRSVLAWWERRCLDLGFSEGRMGLFVDQKWMNLAPGLFDHVTILRHPGCNMAYWNLHERTLLGTPAGYQVQTAAADPVTLSFFHFSGIVVSDPAMLSKHTNRYTLASRPDLHRLFSDYKAAVLAASRPAVDDLPYGFATFSDGATVTRLARRLFAKHQRHLPLTSVEDPFSASSTFARLCRSRGWIAGATQPPKSTWKEFDPYDRRVRAVHALLKLALRILGPHRYELLMRYLSFISVLRNQSIFLRDPAWATDEVR